jgi:hypothetical protein
MVFRLLRESHKKAGNTRKYEGEVKAARTEPTTYINFQAFDFDPSIIRR